MRLLYLDDHGLLSLVEYYGVDIPRYTILSHTWGADHEEVTFKDIVQGIGEQRSAYKKLIFCGRQALADGLRHFWVDTCCIDKSSSSELSEAINSMFSWYQRAEKCYVLLQDVSLAGARSGEDPTSQQSWLPDFKASRWFTRGWTLQELLAPASVEFYSAEGTLLGDRTSLVNEIHDVTGIPVEALNGGSLGHFSVDERLSWARRRQTKREEDIGYSLLGIFSIHMPLIYGEGQANALLRLQREIQLPMNLVDVTSALRASTRVQGENRFELGFHLERVHVIPNFTSRSDSTSIEQALLTDPATGRKVCVLYGLGGIGKTQLALKFAKDNQSKYNSTIFIHGSSDESLRKSFASLHRHIAESKGKEVFRSVMQGREPGSLNEMAEDVMHWLSQEGNNRWLLIFDNVDKDPSDPGGFDVSMYFPPKGHGHIIITTRQASLSSTGSSIRVGRMSDQEAGKLLADAISEAGTHRQMWKSHDWIGKESKIHELLAILDGLPLALSQAAKFITTLNLEPETYLELYNASQREVIDMLSDDPHVQDVERASIRTTWTTSLNLLKSRAAVEGRDGVHHAALMLLQLFAYFDLSDLNYNIIRRGLIGNHVPAWFKTTFSSKLRFFRVIKVLLELCLVDNNVAEGTYSMHRVVHGWLCTYVCGVTDTELLCLAITAIAYSTPLVMAPFWGEEQQQIALHALHILPRLHGCVAEHFLVEYNKMSAQELSVVAAILDEPVTCWEAMKFDYSVNGFNRLLEGCGRGLLDLKDIPGNRSPPKLSDGTSNPIFLIERYNEIGDNGTEQVHLLPELAQEFFKIGSPLWSIKAWNLYALILDGMYDGSARNEAARIWEMTVTESLQYTRSLFAYPTWMVFVNLEHRYKVQNKKMELFRIWKKVEPVARQERHKTDLAQRLIRDYEQLESSMMRN